MHLDKNSEMRVGQVWRVDFLDHFDCSTDTAWTMASTLDIKAPLLRAVGFVVKTSKDTVAMAVSYGQGDSTSPFVILRSAIISAEPVPMPRMKRTRD